MIQKGIIAQVIDKYNYKVRIPKYDKIESATYSTKLDDLSSGIVCSIPGIDIAYVEDDVVLVSFENDELSKPVILGLLYREEKKDSDILVKGVDESLTDIKDDLDKLNSQGLFTHLKYSDDNGATFTSLFSSQNYESNVGSAVVCQPYFDDESAIGINIDKGTKAISWSILDENNTDITDEIEIETIVFDSNNNIIKRERGRNNRLITINNSSKIDGELYLTYRIHTTKKYLDTLHVRLSTDKEPFGVRVGEYVGLYLSFDSTPSSTPADYTWFPIASGAAIDAEINSKIAKLAEEMNQLLNEFKSEVDENFVTLFYKEVTWTQSEVDTYCEIGYQDSWTRSLDGYQGEVKAGNILYITVHNTGSSASIEDDSYGRLEIRALEDTPAGQPVNGQVIGYNVSGEVAIDALARFKSSLLEEGNETLIYGGHITTGRIQDHSGNNYFDLDTGTFNFQDGNGEYIRQVGNGVEINGTLSLSSNVGSTTTLGDIVGDVADFAQDIIDINGDIQHLQDQIDHNVTAWFYPYAPTNSNYPASDWISQGTQNAHLGDIFYDTDTGYSYRWTSDTSTTPPTYSWMQIPDTGVARALQAAADAQDTADSKRRVFVDTPIPPYDIGDLWVQGSTGGILRCSQAKTENQTYSLSDWVAASKYTDDSALNAFTNGTYADFVLNTNNTLSNKITTFYGDTQPTATATGDLWVDTDNGNKLHRWNGTSWVEIQDTQIQQAINNAATAQSTADSKIVTFAQNDEPTATDIGDLWVDTNDNNKMYRWSGSSWVALSDTSALNTFISGTFATTVASLQTGIADAKVQTWNQNADPSLNWSAGDKPKHEGDMWYCTDTTNPTYYGKYWLYDGSAWQEMVADPPQEVFDKIDGKANIFTGDNITPTGMQEGDLWFKGASYPILTYVKISSNPDTYEWREYNKYTDNSAFTAFRDGTYATFVTNTNAALGNKITTFYVAGPTGPTASTTGDLWIDTNDNNKLYRWNGSSWVLVRDTGIQTALTNAANAKTIADSKIITFAQPSQPTASDEGDLWIDTDANNKMYRWSGTAWVALTDKSALITFINGTFADTISQLEAGITDAKVETFYQTNDPSTVWTTSQKATHEGDMWYNSTSSVQKYYRWCKLTSNPDTYGWREMTASPPDEVFDEIDGKATIFTGDTTPIDMQVGDLWFKSVNDPILTYVKVSSDPDTYGWREYNKYTDDSGLTAFVDGTYATFVSNTGNALNRKITTFYQADEPTATVTGDLWIETDNGNKLYRWNGASWASVQDTAIQTALTNAQNAQDTADSKIVTFAQPNQPTATDSGDLWIDTDNNNKMYRWSGSSWVALTDTSALNDFIAGTFATTISNLQTGIADAKVETWRQDNDPSLSWSSGDKPKHEGDMWYCTKTSDTTHYGKYWIYNGSAWEEMVATPPQTVFDEIDGKATIFTNDAQNPPTDPNEGDLWFKSINDPILTYVNNSWVEYNKYTDDSSLTTWLTNTYTSDKLNLQNQIDGKAETWYQSSDPSTTPSPGWNTIELKRKHEGDLWYDTTNKVTYYYNKTSTNPETYGWVQQEIPTSVFNTISGKANIFTGGSTEPTGAKEGDLWFKSANDPIKTYVNGSWVEYNKYTSDAAFNAFKNGAYANFVSATEDALDLRITTFYEPGPTEPTAITEGDLWIDTNDNNKLHRWSGSAWVEVQDGQIQQALTDAGDAYALADRKIITFARDGSFPSDTPTAEDVGDLWIRTNENNKIYRWSGSAWVAISDTSALNSWISNTYTNDKTTLEGMIDGKADTWYQASDPSTTPSPGWNTEALKQKHVGDLWYNTTDKTTSRYNKLTDNPSTYGWVQQEIPTSVFNTINGKAQIFVSQPVPPYSEGDLWFKGANEDILTCTTPKTSSGSYSSSDWVKLNKYTNDARANEAYDKAEDANLRTQRIYYRKRSVGAPNKPTSWVTNTANSIQTGDTYDSSKWTTKIPPLTENASTASSATKYPYLYTCIQTQKNDGTNPTCSDVLLDENTVVIDGGSLIANSVSANEINTGTITVGSLQDGSNYYNTQQTTQAINTAVNNIDIGGTNLLRGSSILSLSANNAGWMANGNGNPEILEDYETYRCLHLSASMTGTAIPSIATRNRINLAWGKTYTVSCYLKFDKQIKINASTPMYYHVGSSENTNLYDLSFNNSKGVSVSLITPSANTIVPANTWVYVEQRITTAASAPDSSLPYPAYRPFVYGSVRSTSESVIVNTWMHSWMFSEGNKAADWSPAPEDALAKSQRIYKRTDNNDPPAAPTSIITSDTDPGTTGNWTIRHIPRIDKTDVSYCYLWTCEQLITVGGVFIGTTNVVADEGTTVIDGGNIITDSVTAAQIDATDLHVRSANIDGKLMIGNIEGLYDSLDSKISSTDVENIYRLTINANEYSRSALSSLANVESMLDIFGWISEYGTYTLTTDTSIKTDKAYYTYDGTTYIQNTNPISTYIADLYEAQTTIEYVLTRDTVIDDSKTYYIFDSVNNTYTSVSSPIENQLPYYYEQSSVTRYSKTEDSSPVSGKTYYSYDYTINAYTQVTPTNTIGSYYELSLDESVKNYILSHISILEGEMSILNDSESYYMVFSQNGIYIKKANGAIVAFYGSEIILGEQANGIRNVITSTRMSFRTDAGDIAYFGLNSDGIWQMHIATTYVDDMIRFGDYAWIKRDNGNMSIKWLGVTGATGATGSTS